MASSRDPGAHLSRAITFFASGMVAEALREANAAAALDPSLRARALIVARMCIRKELEAPGKRASTNVEIDLLTARRR